MSKKYKVEANVIFWVDTWFEDDGTTDLMDQAADQVRDLVGSFNPVFPGSGDKVELGDIEVFGVEEIND